MKNKFKKNYNYYLLLLFFILIIIYSIIPLIVGIELKELKNYEDIQILLAESDIYIPLFTRMITNMLNVTSFSLFKVLNVLIRSLNIFNYIIIVLYLYLMAARKEYSLKYYISYLDIFITLNFIFVMIKLYFIFSFLIKSGSVSILIYWLNTLGFVMIIEYIVLIAYCIFSLIMIYRSKRII